MVLLGGAYFYDGTLILDVLLWSIVLAVVSLFIWKFYKAISKRNLLSLDLNKYNRSEHPLLNKFLAVLLYLLEYIIIMPLLLSLWFGILSVVMFLIAGESIAIPHVLLISAALIGAIRILAYFHNEIAKDLAKLFPFIALSTFLLSFGTFNFSILTERFREIPFLLSTKNLLAYIFVVFVIEIVLRLFYTIYDFWRSEEEETKDNKEEETESLLKE